MKSQEFLRYGAFSKSACSPSAVKNSYDSDQGIDARLPGLVHVFRTKNLQIVGIIKEFQGENLLRVGDFFLLDSYTFFVRRSIFRPLDALGNVPR